MILLLLGCAAEWGLEIDQPELAFTTHDGCSVQLDSAQVGLGGLAAGEEPLSQASGAWDLALGAPGQVLLSSAPRARYPNLTLTQARNGAPEVLDGAEDMQALGASVLVLGELDCGGEIVAFELDFYPDSAADCLLDQPLDLRGTTWVPAELDLQALFSDSLLPGEGETRAQAWVEADADADGIATPDELETVDLAPLGYTVGSYSSTLNLLDHLERASGQLLTLPDATCTHRCLAEDAC